jgi:hypothetical protein
MCARARVQGARGVQVLIRGSQGKAVRLPDGGKDCFAVSVSSNMVCEWLEIQARTEKKRRQGADGANVGTENANKGTENANKGTKNAE